jgi:hypothetical protein
LSAWMVQCSSSVCLHRMYKGFISLSTGWRNIYLLSVCVDGARFIIYLSAFVQQRF